MPALRSLRRVAAACIALLAVATGATAIATPAQGIRLQPLQEHIYKTPDPGNERTESWIFWLLVETTQPRELVIQGAEIQLLAGGKPVRTTVYGAEGVAALAIVPPMAPRTLDGGEPPAPVHWPQGIRLRITEAQAAHVDAMRIVLTLAEGDRTVRGGDPGNHVVIDHGNGEFSLVAHMQAGSVLVAPGDHVAQGQALGKLGSSGDTNTPHVHYQLQSGPDIVWSDGLPAAFTNLTQPNLVRGTFLEAK